MINTSKLGTLVYVTWLPCCSYFCVYGYTLCDLDTLLQFFLYMGANYVTWLPCYIFLCIWYGMVMFYQTYQNTQCLKIYFDKKKVQRCPETTHRILLGFLLGWAKTVYGYTLCDLATLLQFFCIYGYTLYDLATLLQFFVYMGTHYVTQLPCCSFLCIWVHTNTHYMTWLPCCSFICVYGYTLCDLATLLQFFCIYGYTLCGLATLLQFYLCIWVHTM